MAVTDRAAAGGTQRAPLLLTLHSLAFSAALRPAHRRVMLAGLRPRAATLICTAAFRRTATSMSAAKLAYPEPLVFKPAAEHKSTLIMLHGLGEPLQVTPQFKQHRIAACSRRLWELVMLAGPLPLPRALRLAATSGVGPLPQATRAWAGRTSHPCCRQTCPTRSSSSPQPPWCVVRAQGQRGANEA